MRSRMQWEVYLCVMEVARSQRWVVEIVGEFLKSLLGLQDVIKKFAVNPLHYFHLSCFIILYY